MITWYTIHGPFTAEKALKFQGKTVTVTVMHRYNHTGILRVLDDKRVSIDDVNVLISDVSQIRWE